MRFSGVILLISILTGGCARYEYDLVGPGNAQHIGSQSDTVLHVDPLIYRLRSYDNHLVIRIFNPTPDAIQLRGDSSAIVDSNGQHHPLTAQLIAPDAYIKLILPPLPPDTAAGPPPVNPGIGPDADFGPRVNDILYPPMRYANDGKYWDWEDEGTVRMNLTFQRSNQPPFTQTFLFTRQKM